jgi:hypothetical protein
MYLFQTIVSIDDKLEQMRLELRTELGDVRTILGDVYELSARSEVSKFLGSHYTSKFEVFDLNGLVRLALPVMYFHLKRKRRHMILKCMFHHIVFTNFPILFM